MVLYLLHAKCPTCGEPASGLDVVTVSAKDIPEEPDVPWVEVDWKRKRFDECQKGHRFNIRPYADYDDHYVRPQNLADELAKARERLADLERLKEPVP